MNPMVSKNWAKAGCVLFLAAILIPAGTSGQTSWKGTTSTSWGTAANWTAGVPGAGTDAIIGDSNYIGPNQPSLTRNATCKSLTIGAGAVAMTLTAAKALTIRGSLIIGPNGTILHDRMTITVLGDWTNSGTYTAGSKQSAIAFGGITTQIVSGASTTSFQKVTVNAGSVVAIRANATVLSSCTVSGTLDPGEAPTYTLSGKGTMAVSAGGRILVKAATFAGNYAMTGTITLNAASIVDYSATSVNQTVSSSLSSSYGTLRISGSGSKTLAGNLTALNSTLATAGNILVDAGTLDLSSYTANRGTTVAGGTFNVAGGATLKIGGTGTFPANYATHALNPDSTVEYSGTAQTVAADPYGHLTLSSASGAAVKTMPATAMTVVGNLSSTIGSGLSVSFTAGTAITVNGTVSIGAGTTFGGGAFAHAVDGNWINAGTFNGGSGSVTLRGAGAGISGSGSNLFNTLVISGPGVTVASNALVNASGDFSTSGGGTFTHTSGGTGTFTMTGAGKTMSGAGILFNNLSISGSVSAGTSLTVAGNLAVAGTLSASAGTLSMTGSGKTISGAGTISLFALNVPGAIIANSGFSLASDLSVAGTLSASTGTVSFVGTSSFSGAADLFDVTFNGSQLVLGAGSILGVGRNFTLTAGLFDVTNSTPNTVKYYASGAQTIVSTTYNNLLLAGTGTQTAAGGLTVKGDLGINGGATFSGGGYTHLVYGDWVNSGVFNAGAGTVDLRGGQDSSISGGTLFNALAINKDASSALVTLNNSVGAASVNVSTGTVFTGTNSMTITSTRTGNGIILGTITRTHAFVAGLPYAFEGPFNTIDFASVAGVTSVTVGVTADAPADFPFGNSVNRHYGVSLSPTGTYSATLRLHYQDAELNGNSETTMTLWRNAGSWGESGKTSDNSTDNWVEQSGLSDVSGRWTFSDNANVAAWNGSVDSTWEAVGNWTVMDGSPSLPPSTNDTVQIGVQTFSNQPRITTPVVIKNMTFGSVKAVELSLDGGGALRVAGNIGGNWTTNANHNIFVNDRSLTVDGDLILGDGTSGHAIGLNIGAGEVTVAGTLTQPAGVGIAFSGAGKMSIGGDYDYGGGAFTAGTGTVTYNGSLAQTVAGGINYNKLVLSKAGGTATLSIPSTVGGDLLVATGGTFLVNASLVVSGKVEILSGATMNGGGSMISVGGDWLRSGAFDPNSGTVTLNGSGTQTVAASTFNILIINKAGGAAILAGNLILGGDLLVSSGSLDLSTNTAGRSAVGGTFSLGAGALLRIGSGNVFPLNFAVQTLSAASTVEYYGGVQTVSPVSYGNLVLSNGGSSPKTLAGSTTVAGDLVINSGATFAGSSFPLTVQGNWTNNGTFNASSGSVTLGGSSKALSGTSRFNNLSVTGSYTASGDVSVDGVMTVSGTFNAGSTATALAGNLLNSGVFQSGGTVTFAGSGVQSIALNSGFTSTGTVDFNGSVSPSFSGSTSPTFYNVNINNTAAISPGVGWTVGGTFLVGTGSTFNGGAATHLFGGGFTNNGAVTSGGTLSFNPASAVTLKLRGTSFASSGDVVLGGSAPVVVTGGALSFTTLHIANTHPSGVTPATNWTVNGDLVIATGATLNGGVGLSHTVTGNWSDNGTFNGQSSTVTLNGTAEISGIGSTVFNHVNFSGTNTATADFGVTGNFANNGTFDATGVTVTFSGSGSSSLGGSTTPTPFDTLVIGKDGAAVTLALNLTNLTSMTVSGGTLDTSTFAIDEDVGGGLTIGAGAAMRIGGSRTLPVFDLYSFDPSSTVEYYGTGSQTIAAQNYGNLVSSLSGARTLAITAPIGIAGTFTPGANAYTITGSTISYNGAGTQTIAAFNYNNLSNELTGARILAPSGTIGIAGVFTPGANSYTNTGSSINFNGGSQIIPAFTYFNLLTSGTGVKTIGGTVTANGSLTLGGGSLTNAGFTVTVNGDVANSVTNFGTGKITLASGASTHSLSGTGIYYNVEVNDAAGAALLTNMTVNGTLTLTAGKVATGANRVIMGVGGNVVRVAGYVDGNLQKNVATGNALRTFEIGDTSGYTPVVMQFTNVTTAGNVTVRTTGGEHSDIGNSGVFSLRDVNRYWSATNSGTVFANLGATFTFLSSDVDAGAVPTNFIAALKAGGSWTLPAVVSRTTTNIQVAGMTALGDSVVGESVPTLYVSYPIYGLALPFRSVKVTATGSGVGVVGTMWFTNQWARGTVTGSFPATNSWSTLLSLPDNGQYTFTICGSNAVGAVLQDTVRFRRQPSRVYWLTSP